MADEGNREAGKVASTLVSRNITVLGRRTGHEPPPDPYRVGPPADQASDKPAIAALPAPRGAEMPADPVARSHFIYQQRTLWAGAVVALLGAILVVVNIGVFVLFALALWLLVRGAAGVLRLKSGRPIDDPRHWLI